MPGSSVQRTIVKSQPEIWPEVSDVASLSRHLDGVGEISITAVTPETTVAWEGDRVRGTVTLERSGWGTKVTVTAETEEAEELPESLAEATEAEAAPRPSTVETLPPPGSLPTVDETTAPRLRWWQRLRRRRTTVDEAHSDSLGAAAEQGPEPGAIVVPDVEPELIAVIEPAPDYDLEAILGAMLDHLSAAHHRPFSRG